MQRGRNGRNAESRYGEGIRNPRARQRALVAAVAPDEPDLSELRELLRTAGVAVAGELVQRRAQPDPDRYLGKGKLTELKRAIAEAGANLVAVDDELLPRQERNHEGAGRDADRDRPAPRARPDRRAPTAARADARDALDDAPGARARAPADGRPRRLHERRQVDA